MIFFFSCLILALFVCLFILHVMTREDYALMRRNISMEQLYNIVFIVFLCGILSARLFYIIFNFHTFYLNPVVFFAPFYFPGLSLFGAICGIFTALAVICYQKNYPWRKFFDMFSIAFASGLPLAALGTSTLHSTAYFFPIIISVVFYGLMGIIAFTILYKRLLRNSISDGIPTCILLVSISIAYCFSLFLRTKSLSFLQQPEVISLFLFSTGQVIFFGYLLYSKKKERV